MVELVAGGIAAAQAEYLERKGHYAANLWELHDAKLIAQDLASGVSADFVYRVTNDGPNWQLEIRRDRDGVTFRLAENQELIPLSSHAREVSGR